MPYTGGTVLLSPVEVLVMRISSVSTTREPLDVAGDSSPEEGLGLVEKNPGEADLRGDSKPSFIKGKGLGGAQAGDGLLVLVVPCPGKEAGDGLPVRSLQDGVEGKVLEMISSSSTS